MLATVPAPAPGKDQDPAVAAAWAALRVAEQAASVGELAPLEQAVAANPDDHKSRFDLAVALSAKGDRQGAADQLLEIIRRDREVERRGGAQATVAAVRSLGPDGPGDRRRASEAVGDLVLNRRRPRVPTVWREAGTSRER